MTNTVAHDASIARPATVLDSLGAYLARYGLVIVIGWIGLMKLPEFVARGIEPLVSNSPLRSWMYDTFSVTTCSALLGVLAVAAAVLLAVKPWAPRLSAV